MYLDSKSCQQDLGIAARQDRQQTRILLLRINQQALPYMPISKRCKFEQI
jgi:hypothetical protein